ncbi:hypothetical protein CDEST_00241 [Colletotrichum destructivum]|uniref:Uncharacterized protein n=1 Tax=Colletotrichum destructivum TaxID=34406 RepID=A0AAX4HWU2_9PEZI|nr:hypothetical protein CDEST_00241 [Colletotrichum destructivum]
MKTTTILAVLGLAAPALAQCGAPKGAKCTTPGQIACEYMGGHMLYCDGHWKAGTNCAAYHKPCLCEKGTCGP